MIRRRCSFKKYAWNVVSGKSPLIINNSERDRFRSFSVIGKSEQVTTNGTQLFDANKMNGLTKSGVTVSVKDGMITATGMATKDEWIQAYISVEEYKKIFKPGEKIFIKSYKTTDCNYDFGLYGAHGSPILGTVTESNSQPNGALLPTIYPARDTDFYFFVSVKQGVTLQGSLQPMVYQTGNGTYEPYTGGKPSPSPDYPQEIKSVGKWNPETQKYEVEVTINSSNLFKVTEHTTGYYTVKDGKVQFNKSIGYSWAVVVNNLHKQTVILHITTAINTRYRMYCTDLEGTILYKYEDSSANANDNSHTFNMPDGVKKIYMSVLEINSAEQAEIALNLGNTALPFEPYKEQTVTLTSDRPITKWDKLVEQDGQIGWLYKSQIIDRFDGKSNKVSLGAKKGEVQHFSIEFKNTPKGNGNTDIYVDKYRAVPSSYALEEFGICCNWNDGIKYFSAPNINITNTEEFKAWLSENPLTLEYETETPEFIPLPQSEQDSIRVLISYSPTTIITVDGGEVDPSAEVLCAIKEMM